MAQRPNVVLLITHDTGRHVSPYGVETVDTPHCERLAAEGVRFAHHYCTTPLCSPSRAAIVTGRYPHSNGVMGLTHGNFGWDLHDDETPIATLFGPAGYDTWLLAGQHETKDPARLGFDVVDANHSLMDTPEHWAPLVEGRDGSRPFFCQIGGFETHRGWELYDTPPDDSKGVFVPPYLNDGPETRKELAQFQGMVKRFDVCLGRLMDFLDAHGLAENTILAVTTDHGIAMPRAKSTLYDPGIGTMLFLRYPAGNWGEGAVRDELVSNVDVLPTLLDACGIEIPARIQGRSFLPLLTGDAGFTPRDAVFAEKTFHDTYDPIRGIRTERWKYIRNFEKIGLMEAPSDIYHQGADLELGRRYAKDRPPEELYDLHADPDEMRNVAGKPENAQTVATLRTRLADWMRETNDPLMHGPIASPFFHRNLREMFGSDT